MALNVSYDVRYAPGLAPAHEHAMPQLDGVETWDTPFVDRIGETIRDSPVVAGLSSVGGVVGGALLGARLLGRHPLLGILGGGALGAVGGFAGLMGAKALFGGDRHAAPASQTYLPQAPTDVKAAEQVKVMTYNIHGGMGGPKEKWSSGEEMDALAKVIRREQPDILLLQEVDDNALRSNFGDNLEGLTERLDPDGAVVAAPGTDLTGRTQSVGVMTFNGYTVDNARNLISPDPHGAGVVRRSSGFVLDARKAINEILDKPPPQESTPSYSPRNTAEALVTSPEGTTIRVMSGHYQSPRPDYDSQSDQIAPLAEQLDAWKGPTIWGGDFNVGQTGTTFPREREIMTAAGLFDPYNSAGIDRIWASSQHFRAEEAYKVVEEDLASDHSPIVATLTLKPTGDDA